LSTSESATWKQHVDDSLTQFIYPLARSGFIKDQHPESSLTVTSATIFVGGGYPGAKVTTTTLERDSGMITAHIDLGTTTSSTATANPMGGLYFESLLGDASSDLTSTIVGPLSPGQLVVHRSLERTAAMILPSNLHEIEAVSKEQNRHSGIDSPLRREILKTAETARHYCLRLTLTTVKTNSDMDNTDVREAPAEERSYRLRSFARFRDDDRVRFLTLAGIIDVKDYENHLWLGFDYSARATSSEDGATTTQRMSDINKAIFHLQKATELCPTDSRAYFQLGTALGARNSLMNKDGDGTEEYAELAQIADALKRSAQIETVAVKLGIHDIHDLAICLNGLATTLCKMGELDSAVDVISEWAECGSIRSVLAFEDLTHQKLENNIPSFDRIKANGRDVAVTTYGDVPVFEEADIALIRASADRRFAQANGAQTSRYTMQYEGNAEVHLDDLCKNDPALKERMDSILKEKIYPLVRAAFKDQGINGDYPPPLGALSVYDSIFVRYNGDVARKAGRIGASQPLHQDGGMYSVNIALNAHKDDARDGSGFTGGGTFLEALTIGDDETVRRPVAPGHALLHRTTQRHAGAPTTSGIRDILVIFLTARRPEIPLHNEFTYGIETAMRLQTMAKELQSRADLIRTIDLARSYDPMNSEMSYWLGVHLMQGDSDNPSDERWEEVCRGVEALEAAIELNPADARAHYHLGMAISARHKYAMRTKRAHLLPPAADAAGRIIEAFEEASRLESKCEHAGCKNGINIAAGYLSLGDFMARLRSFEKAIKYLSQVEITLGNAGQLDEPWARGMLEEMQRVKTYCESESAKISENAII
jgi:tetratricopeptide (TPR) repeat protein